MKNGLIKKQISNQYTIIDLDSKCEFIAVASGKLRYMRVSSDNKFNKAYGRKTKTENKTMKVSPKVGDIIHYIKDNDVYRIEDISPRKNDLKRPDIANVDQVLLLFAATEPVFSFHLLDQFLLILKQHNLDIVLTISKIDLVEEKVLNELKEKLDYYKKNLDLKIFYINSLDKDTLKKIDPIFKDKITVLAGQTGVGKSTLLNALIPNLNIKTQEISKALGRGRHTTRHSELYDYNKGYICDTPGFSKLDINIYELEDLKALYEDFRAYDHNCKFSSCMHVAEPKCGIKDAVANGEILKERYNNYLDFYKEVKANKNKY